MKTVQILERRDIRFEGRYAILDLRLFLGLIVFEVIAYLQGPTYLPYFSINLALKYPV